jgi:lipopolysaccharide transport system ATP-binding protein
VVGIIIKDHLNVSLYADNTRYAFESDSSYLSAGQILLVKFMFAMPVLAIGEYVIAIAVSDGSESDHVQLHWLNSAVFIRCTDSRVTNGLSGLNDLILTAHVE